MNESPISLVNAFLGPYQLTAKFAEGGTGVIYLAETPQSTHCRKYVAKILQQEHVRDKDIVDGLKREFDLLKSIEHPGFPRVLRMDTVRGLPGFVMDFIEGSSCYALVKEGRVFSRQAAFLFMVRLVALLHNDGIIHSDIKPENFIIRPADGKTFLIDFGNARRQEKLGGITTAFFRRKRLARIRGTPAYMAPEVLQGKRQDFRSDVFSLGACAHFLFTNSLLVGRSLTMDPTTKTQTLSGGELRINVPGLSRDLNDLLSRCIRNDPEARPESAVFLLENLRRHITKEMVAQPDRLSRQLAEKAKVDAAKTQRELELEAAKRSEIAAAAKRVDGKKDVFLD